MDFFDELIKGKRKVLTTALMALWFVPLTIYGGIKVFDYPGRCVICHSMKPEYYTWQASVHGKAQVVCLSCHSEPGIKNLVKQKWTGLKEIYYTATDSYTTPIKVSNTVKDGACERCHDMSKREVADARSRNLNVPHQAHKAVGIPCSKCHVGIAHGNIANRKVTYAADYPRWTKLLGETMMNDIKQVQVQMETCMRCHMLRKVSKKCESCHPAGKQPSNHKTQDFVNKTHGSMAKQDVKQCDSCHGYMSGKTVDILDKEEEVFKQYLKQQSGKKESSPVIPYSRANTFCRDCHAKRPQSHKTDNFRTSHSEAARINKDGCSACHDNYSAAAAGGKPATANGQTVTLVSCGNCHPSSHSTHIQWKMGYHPYPLPNPPRLTRSCYSCHTEEKCGRCHGVLK